MKNNQPEWAVMGVDIGGSHITAAYIDSTKAKLLSQSLVRKSVNSHGSAQEILNRWVEVLRLVIAFRPNAPDRIGIAMPGPFDYANGISLIKNMNKYEALYGHNIKEYLAEHLQLSPEIIYFVNDAEAFLAGEVVAGAAKNFESALGLTLGTGLGSAKYVDRNINDLNLGSSPFMEGIAEDYLSTRGMIGHYKLLSNREIKNVKELVAALPIDPHAVQAMEKFIEQFTEFLTWLLTAHEVAFIVIGGNIAKAHQVFLPSVKTLLQNRGIATSIAVSQLGEDAAMIGAAHFLNVKKN